MRHVVSVVVGGVAGLVTLAADAGTAEACSPPYEEPIDPCTELRVITPGESFPLNLEREIRVSLSNRGTYTEPADDFALEMPFTVARATGDGYEDVAFSLVDEPDLVPNARALRLEEPVTGDYIVSWEAESCSTITSPDGRGMLVGEFTITEEIPLPRELGVATSRPQELVSQSFSLGTDSSCQPITADAVVARNEVEVELSEEARPWASVMQTAIYVDGELFRGFARAGSSAAESGTLTATLDHICSTDDPSLLDSQPNRLEEGTHEVYVVAQLGDLAEVQSQATTIEVDCDEGGATCSLGGRARPSDLTAFLLLFGALLFQRRTHH